MSTKRRRPHEWTSPDDDHDGVMSNWLGPPLLPGEDEARCTGPYFASRYDGTCTGCGLPIRKGDRIREDSGGGYLGECCA